MVPVIMNRKNGGGVSVGRRPKCFVLEASENHLVDTETNTEIHKPESQETHQNTDGIKPLD